MSFHTFQVFPDVPLIPQDLDHACWYASAQMLIQWRQDRTHSTEAAFSDPSEVPAAELAHLANDGLSFRENVHFATLLGLQPVPRMTPTEDTIFDWLQNYGPIWAAGKFVEYVRNTGKHGKLRKGGSWISSGHAVVITGISPEFGLNINDPWPPLEGDIYWQPFFLDSLVEWGDESNFLHFPY